MSEQAERTKAILSKAFTFRSVSGKNANFTSSIQEDHFLFRTNEDPLSNQLFVPAGGTISYNVPLKFELSSVPYYIFYFISSGEGTFFFQKQTITVGRNDILLFPAGEPISFATSLTPFTSHLYFLSGAVFDTYTPALFEEMGFFKTSLSEVESSLPLMLSALPAQLASSAPESSLHLASIWQMILSILTSARCHATSAALPKHVTKMKDIFDSDYQLPHTLEDLEDVIGVNKFRLCRDFSKHIGTSPLQYLNQVRLTHARELLCTTDLTIHEVGIQSGFENTNHFINLFKKSAGITPLQFRQKHTT